MTPQCSNGSGSSAPAARSRSAKAGQRTAQRQSHQSPGEGAMAQVPTSISNPQRKLMVAHMLARSAAKCTTFGNHLAISPALRTHTCENSQCLVYRTPGRAPRKACTLSHMLKGTVIAENHLLLAPNRDPSTGNSQMQTTNPKCRFTKYYTFGV